ncbi:hypothetical protein C8Q80DRAFT_1349912 [Daedaleopsis nitida]|nr:hypothetical protein C8Q80DRAFT_1349912 [Daedaleopsis nitida]
MPDPKSHISGPVNNNRTRADLVEIATALGLCTTSKDGKTKLVPLIQKHLKAHPELADQRAFQSLQGGRKKGTQQKDTEEDAVGQGGGKVTGANKVLRDMNITTDPPPRHTRRSSAALTQALGTPALKEANIDSLNDDSSTTGSSPPTTPAADGLQRAFDDKHEHSPDLAGPDPRTPVKSFATYGSSRSAGNVAGKPISKATVIVSFLDPDNLEGPVDEVCVEESRRLKVERTVNVEGTERVFCRLSELVPVAIEQAGTPMKNRQARLYRAGLRSDGGRIDLGSVQAIADGKRVMQPEMTKVDRFELDPVVGEDDTFVCRLFVRDTAPVHKKPHTTAVLPAPSTTTGQAHVVVSSVATLSTDVKGAAPSQGSRSKDELVVFLRELLGGPAHAWKKAKTAGHVLERLKTLEGAMQMLEELGWGKSKGGYLIPNGYEGAGSLSGHSFIKDDVLRALHLGHSQVSDDAALFKKDTLAKIPNILDWYENGDASRHAERFNPMLIGDFRRYQERKCQERKAKAKRKVRESSDDERDAKRRKKGKGKKRATSEELDNSSESPVVEESDSD